MSSYKILFGTTGDGMWVVGPSNRELKQAEVNSSAHTLEGIGPKSVISSDRKSGSTWVLYGEDVQKTISQIKSGKQ